MFASFFDHFLSTFPSLSRILLAFSQAFILYFWNPLPEKLSHPHKYKILLLSNEDIYQFRDLIITSLVFEKRWNLPPQTSVFHSEARTTRIPQSILVNRDPGTCLSSSRRNVVLLNNWRTQGLALSYRTPGRLRTLENVSHMGTDMGCLPFSGVCFVQRWDHRRKHQHCNCRSDSSGRRTGIISLNTTAFQTLSPEKSM